MSPLIILQKMQLLIGWWMWIWMWMRWWGSATNSLLCCQVIAGHRGQTVRIQDGIMEEKHGDQFEHYLQGDVSVHPPTIAPAEIDRWGFPNTEEPKHRKRKEGKRVRKWQQMAQPYEQNRQTRFHFCHAKLERRVWKGIPDAWRSAVWWDFLQGPIQGNEKGKEQGRFEGNADGHVKCVDGKQEERELVEQYHELLRLPYDGDRQIELDIPRTSQHVLFCGGSGGQTLLFRLLHALALYYPHIGYVQGMGPIISTLLSYYAEEDAFVMGVRVLRRLLAWYENDFSLLMKESVRMEALLGEHPYYLPQWWLTLFVYAAPPDVYLPIWDVYFSLRREQDQQRLFTAATVMLQSRQRQRQRQSHSHSLKRVYDGL